MAAITLPGIPRAKRGTKLDGTTAGPTAFTGKIGKSISFSKNPPVVNFAQVADGDDLISFPSDVFDDLSKIYSFNFSPIYLEVDGNFPHHPADPSDEENLKDLKWIHIYAPHGPRTVPVGPSFYKSDH